MFGYPFTQKELRNAARTYAERWVVALEEAFDQSPVQLSPAFQQKMSVLRAGAEAAYIKKRRFRTRFAAVCIVIILFLTALFSFSETARARVFNWIKEFYEEYVLYRFFGNQTDDELSGLSLEWIPDGFKLTDEETDVLFLSFCYENDSGDAFILDCDKTHSGLVVAVIDGEDERDHFIQMIAGHEVECYVSENEDSDYIWHDSDGKAVYSLNSNLPHEINVKIIENIKEVK